MNPSDLQRFVLDEMRRYLDGYESPAPSTALGTPWTKDKIAIELEAMRSLLIEPYESSYLCGGAIDATNNPPRQKPAWVVASDGIYRLLFDPEARDFVLAHASGEGKLSSWGIRGDASSTFLAR